MERPDTKNPRPATLAQYRGAARRAGVHWDTPADLLELYFDYADPWMRDRPAYPPSSHPALPAIAVPADLGSMSVNRTYGLDADGFQVEFDPFAGDPETVRPRRGILSTPLRETLGRARRASTPPPVFTPTAPKKRPLPRGVR